MAEENKGNRQPTQAVKKWQVPPSPANPWFPAGDRYWQFHGDARQAIG